MTTLHVIKLVRSHVFNIEHIAVIVRRLSPHYAVMQASDQSRFRSAWHTPHELRVYWLQQEFGRSRNFAAGISHFCFCV